MTPYQYGEVYVTSDNDVYDLDLGVSEGAIKCMGGFITVASVTLAIVNNSNITISVALHSVHGQSVDSHKKALDAGFSSVMKNASVEAKTDTIGGQEHGVTGSREIASEKDCQAVTATRNDLLAAGKTTFMETSNKSIILHEGSRIPKAIKEYVIEGNHSEDEGFDPREIVKAGVEAIEPEEKVDSAIVVCGTGIGISIAINPVNCVRCAPCYKEETIRLARIHNDSNVSAPGARIISSYKPVELVKSFLIAKTSAENGHQVRVNQTKIILLLRRGCRKMDELFNSGLEPELKKVVKSDDNFYRIILVYYNGCENVDKSENLAIDCFKQLFTCNHKPGQCKEGNFHANVPPHSCSQADAEAYAAI
uniref:Fructose-bisphosphate aldolase n=1 Tax=Eufriesea mexicana TaxID=516756 RepID=A0A310SFI3_9HYME